MFETITKYKVEDRNKTIHIIGCGAVGSWYAVMLAKMGHMKFDLWDLDEVEEHNVVNQAYNFQYVGRKKVWSLKEMIKKINPTAEVRVMQYFAAPDNADEWAKDIIVFALDSIDDRRLLFEQVEANFIEVEYLLDARMALTDGMIFFVDEENISKYKKTLNYTHEEAVKAVPVTACGAKEAFTLTPLMAAINLTQLTVSRGCRKWLTFDAFSGNCSEI